MWRKTIPNVLWLVLAFAAANIDIAAKAEAPPNSAVIAPSPPVPIQTTPNSDVLPIPPSPSPIGLATGIQTEALPSPISLTLSQLESLALSNNPSLAQFAAAVSSADGNWLQVGLYPNPDVGYAANQIGDRGTAGQQGAWFSQTLVTGHKLRLNRAAASQEVARTQQNLLAQRYRVLTDVRLRYYDALVAQQAFQVTSSLLKISAEGVSIAESLLKAQEASGVDVLQAKIERDVAHLNQVRAANRQAAAWRSLAAVCGVSDLKDMSVSGDIFSAWPQLEWQSSLQRLWQQSPELSAARANVARAGWVLERARVEPIPNLDTQFSPQYDTNAHNANYTVLTSIKYPLWNKNQGNIRAAQAELMAARAIVTKLELALQQRLAQTFERYANALQQSQRYRKDIMPNAQATLDMVTKGYRQGEFPYLTLLTGQRTYFQVNLAYVESLRDLWQSAATIDGLLLVDSLATEASSGPAVPSATGMSGTPASPTLPTAGR